MKVSVNPRVKRLLDIYASLPPEKKEALEKIAEVYSKENEEKDGKKEN